jgi:hypothetical protein
MSQDTSSTGVLSMLFEFFASLIIKAALVGGVVVGLIGGVVWFLFR